MLKIGIIVSSTRPGRKGRAIAQWVEEHGAGRGDAAVQVVDLADFDLSHLDEAVPAVFGTYTQQHTRDWSATIAELDAFVVVVPEYNHSFPGALKTALDFLYDEWQDKAVAFVGYGIDGGQRAVEQLRPIVAELGLADIGPQVAIRLMSDIVDGHVVGDAPAEQLSVVLDKLIAWGEAMKTLRPQP
ncbi:MAG: NAD(P)H-dependent oxidoreductase [Pseudonocardia sp.]|nr:NAD(P)H-dependent oxidoreductase [Pseudonocardia sp.]